MSEMPWFKFDTKAWLEGTRGLTPEQRGIYVDCLCIMYRTERPLPLCDKRMSHALEISVRLWKSVKQALLNAGKLIETADGYTNERVQFELDSRSTQRRVKSESAVKREREKREKRESVNENNEAAPQLCENSVLDRREERKEEEREEKNKQLALEQEAPREELAGLNGATSDILAFVESAMIGGDRKAAVNWLSKTVNIYGAPVVKRAYQKLHTDLAEGAVIARPLQTLSAIAERMRNEPEAAPRFSNGSKAMAVIEAMKAKRGLA